MGRVTLLVGRTSRIRRRRAQDVADTTDSLRAVACIRFVRLVLVVGLHGGPSEHLIEEDEEQADHQVASEEGDRPQQDADHA